MNTLDIQNTLLDGRNKAPVRTITRANMHIVRKLLEGGEALENILSELEINASNAAIIHLANNNKMIGPHRKDFQVRTRIILASRRT